MLILYMIFQKFEEKKISLKCTTCRTHSYRHFNFCKTNLAKISAVLKKYTMEQEFSAFLFCENQATNI
jgi:hypothetical protein